jgi:hypothetical protein
MKQKQTNKQTYKGSNETEQTNKQTYKGVMSVIIIIITITIIISDKF